MDSTRQERVARQIQRDLSEIFQREITDLLDGAMVTVTAVRISPDLGYAKVYLSIFPFAKTDKVMIAVEGASRRIRGLLGGRVKHQLRIVPELSFFADDSLEYIENIDNLLK